MRGMPQAGNGGKMRRGTRAFTGTSVIIEFVPVSGNVTSSVRVVVKPHPTRGFAATLPGDQ